MEFDFEKMVEVFENGGNVKKNLKDAALLDYVQKRIDVTDTEAMLLCYCYYLQAVKSEHLTADHLLKIINVKKKENVETIKAVANLLAKSLLILVHRQIKLTFNPMLIPECALPKNVLDLFVNGKFEEIAVEKIKTFTKFKEKIEIVRKQTIIYGVTMVDEHYVVDLELTKIKNALEPDLPFYSSLIKLKPCDLYLFGLLVVEFFEKKKREFDFRYLVGSSSFCRPRLESYFGIDGLNLPLVKEGLIKLTNVETDSVKEINIVFPDNLFSALKKETKSDDDSFYPFAMLNLVKDVKEKQLFFAGETKETIEELKNILREENFNNLIAMCNQNGLKPAITAVFYGVSGTGKTELALQLAKMSNRKVLKVNLEEVESMWLGESEKNVKDIFKEYRESLKGFDSTPILLLNEADSILGNRINIERSVDKTINNVVNVFLDEFENFEGILIVTTNLVDNLDSAFFRRFSYKIRFELPNVEARKMIWQSKFPNLEDSLLDKLALFPLTGGEIDNILKRYIFASSLKKVEDGEVLLKFAEEESVLKGNAVRRQKVGFVS